MFDNIGKKIKILSKTISICMMILFIICGFFYIIIIPEQWYVGLLIIILGCLFSWIGSFFIYGFGELVENSAIIAGKQKLDTNNKESEFEKLEEERNDVALENECPCCFHNIKPTDKECGYCGTKLNNKS